MAEVNSSEKSQSELAYDQLYDAIRRGVFQPGDRVREADVASRFSLSRTPVREALRKLEADGIIEHKARLGAVVRSLNHAEVVELYEMRIVLERTASEMAAQHANRAEIDELAEINDAIAEARHDPPEAARLNQHFHRCIYLAARNRFLMESARALNNALMLLGPTTLEDEPRITQVVAQHRSIIEAIEARDEEAAGAAAEAHLEMSMRHRLRSLRS